MKNKNSVKDPLNLCKYEKIDFNKKLCIFDKSIKRSL